MGGSEKFFISLVNNFYRRGYDPLVILLEEENPLLTALDNGIKCVLVNRKFKYDLSISRRIRKTLKEYGIQTVFCVEPYAFFLARMASFFDPQLRFFLSLHNSLPIGVKKYVLEMAYLRFFRKNDRAIFICNYQRDYFGSRYLFKPSHSSVIYNGVDTEHYSPAAAECQLDATQHAWRGRAGISKAEKAILMVGRISPEKGHVFAIQALHHLHSVEEIRAHLVIVGSGDNRLLEELKGLVGQYGLERYVHFEGGQGEVRHYLLHADVFVMTSVSETFSLAALEALSMGIPCSLTRIGGAPEMLVDDEMGSLCEARNIESIAASWKNIICRNRDRTLIRQMTVKSFSDKEMFDRYEEALKSGQ
ncbi:MAG TPA: glycosyltransferase family 4 protein [Chitinophagaceae bacterium]|nr:glycosyltransferase family 4 protein [Chitinophagaceae bacterium]